MSFRFKVDLRGDLVTAWMRGYPPPPSENGLKMLSRLMGCARPLDMLMKNESIIGHYLERVLAEDFQAFA